MMFILNEIGLALEKHSAWF